VKRTRACQFKHGEGENVDEDEDVIRTLNEKQLIPDVRQSVRIPTCSCMVPV
jgi:hypothetical protein